MEDEARITAMCFGFMLARTWTVFRPYSDKDTVTITRNKKETKRLI